MSVIIQSCQTLRSCGLQPARLLCPRNSPGKNTGVCCHSYANYILCFFYQLACYVSVSIKITFVVQSLSCVWLFVTPKTAECLVLHHLPEFAQTMSIESVMSSYHLILCHPLLLLPSVFPSIRVFSNESALCIRSPKYWSFSFSISSVQSLSHVGLFETPWTTAGQASLSIINFWNLLKLISIESVMPSNHLILCCPLLLLSSILPRIRVFSNESVLCIRWLKY